MFFSFQTPSSEYAQALVDFHHYVFFFLVVVILFVIWMIKLSLLFVLREKNLIWVPSEPFSDFYWEHNNAWFGSKGEFYYLVHSLYVSIKELIIYGLYLYQIALPLDAVFFFKHNTSYALYLQTIDFVYFCIGRWNLNKIFFFFFTFTRGFKNNWFHAAWSLNFLSLDASIEPNLTKPTLKFLCNKANFFAKLANINIIVGQTSKAEDLFIEGYHAAQIDDLNFKSQLNSHFIESNLLVSSIAPLVLSKVKIAFRSTRLSHWLWGGKMKNIFLLFSGEGDAYSFDSTFFHGFDENLQIPHASKFVDFYTQDIYRNSFLFFQNVRHRLVLEWVWTFLPTLILLTLVIPSLYLLYTYDRPYVTAPYMTFKAIGNQWYWAYEYWDYENASGDGGLLSFSSNMLHEDELNLGQLRLLEVDRRLVLPAGVCIRLITTSVDVLHSWAVPAFGVKIDSVPGRLNQFWLVLNKPGVYYGQCSELCGINHGFMPIAVEVVFLEQFLEFLQLDL